MDSTEHKFFVVSRCVALCLFLIAVGCAPELTTDELMTRSRGSIEANDWAAAEVDLKSVLQKEPENAEARALYGQIHIARSDTAAAIDQFDRSLAASADPGVSLSLAKALSTGGQSGRLIERWRNGDFIAIEEQREFQAALARAMMAQERPEEARLAFERARSGDGEPNDFVDVAVSIGLLQLDQDVDGAKTILANVVDRSPENAEALRILGMLAIQDQDLAKAEEFYVAAVNANPYGLDDKLQLVEVQLRLGELEDADKNLARLESALPRNNTLALLRARLLFDQGEYAESVSMLDQVISNDSSQLSAILLAASANLRLERFQAARRWFEQFLEQRPDNSYVSLRLAQLYLLLSEPTKADALAQKVLAGDENNTTALGILANALSAQGMHVESADALRRLTELAPASTGSRIALGSQHVLAGDVDLGVKELSSVVEDEPTNALARERLIEARLAMGDVSKASVVAQAYLDDFPDSVRARTLLANVRLRQQRNEEARALYKEAISKDPALLPAYNGLASLALLEDNVQGARKAFEDALRASPGNLSASLNLAMLLDRQGEQESLKELLRDTILAHPEELLPRIAMSRIALIDGQPGRSLEFLQPIVGKFEEDPGMQRSLAATYFALEDYDKAKAATDRLLALQPDDVEALVAGTQIAMIVGDLDVATSRIERAIELSDDNIALHLLAIDVYLAQGRWADAKTKMEALPADIKARPNILIQRGRASLAMSEMEAARDLFSEALDLQPSSQAVALLSATEWAMEERTQALSRLESWLKENPEDSAIRNDFATKLLMDGQQNKAIDEYRILLDIEPKSLVALNNLAWLLRESDTDTALAYIKLADDLAPTSADVKDTYAMVELSRGEFDRALLLNEKAVTLSQGNHEVALNRVKILIAAERNAEAKRYLDRLMGESDFQLDADAEALLAELN